MKQALSVLAAAPAQPALLDVAIALLGVARGRPRVEQRTLVDASGILLAAAVADGAVAPGETLTEPRRALGGARARKLKRRSSPRFGRKPRQAQASALRSPPAPNTPPGATPAAAPGGATETFNGVGFDPVAGVVSFGDLSVVVTTRELAFAKVMARALPNLMDYEQLARRVWNRALDDQAKGLVQQLASTVRPKLAGIGLNLKTVHGMGYALGVADENK